MDGKPVVFEMPVHLASLPKVTIAPGRKPLRELLASTAKLFCNGKKQELRFSL
jgi:hypothetical protein